MGPLENHPDCVVWHPESVAGGVVTWNGACRNGKAEGEGVLAWRHPVAGEWQEHRFTGTMRGGKMQGPGVTEWADGRRFEDGWQDDLQQGRGMATWADGQRWEGDFRDGEPIGDCAPGSAYSLGVVAGYCRPSRCSVKPARIQCTP